MLDNIRNICPWPSLIWGLTRWWHSESWDTDWPDKPTSGHLAVAVRARGNPWKVVSDDACRGAPCFYSSHVRARRAPTRQLWQVFIARERFLTRIRAWYTTSSKIYRVCKWWLAKPNLGPSLVMALVAQGWNPLGGDEMDLYFKNKAGTVDRIAKCLTFPLLKALSLSATAINGQQAFISTCRRNRAIVPPLVDECFAAPKKQEPVLAPGLRYLLRSVL